MIWSREQFQWGHPNKRKSTGTKDLTSRPSEPTIRQIPRPPGHGWSAFETLELGWIPTDFKNFIFKPKLSVLRKNPKNYNYDEFPDFYEFTLYMIF